MAEIPIRADSPDGGSSSVAVGEGVVWAQCVAGRLFKVDPATNEIIAMVPLDEWSSHLAVSEGAVRATLQFSFGSSVASASRPPGRTRSWRAQEHLVRMDSHREQVVASEHIEPVSTVGFGRVVAGGGYVWSESGSELARVAP